LFPGERVRCIATVTPANASYKSVIFAPLIPRRATVTCNGFVTTHSVGYAGVSATSVDGGFTAVTLFSIIDPSGSELEPGSAMEALPYQVTGGTLSEEPVQATVLESLAFASSSVSLYLESAHQTQLIPSPETYPLAEVIYSSDHPSIVSVSSTGLLTVLESGFVTLTATLGSQTATMSVITGAKVTGVIIDPRTTTSMKRGRSTTVLANVIPSNSLNPTVIWTSDNPIVATVTDTGHVDTYTSGVVTITVTTVEGGYKASVSIRVT